MARKRDPGIAARIAEGKPGPDASRSESGAVDAATNLDLRGLRCPLPVLHVRRALARSAAGAVIHVRCTDPLASLDIPNLLRETGDTLLAASALGDETAFRILKAG